MKLGLHFIGNPSDYWNWLDRVRPTYTKVLDCDDPAIWARLAQYSQFVGFRRYVSDGEDKPECYQYKRLTPQQFLNYYPLDKLDSSVIIECPNEQQVWNGDDAREYAQWLNDYVDVCHSKGYRVGVLNFPTGHPDPALLVYFREVAKKANAVLGHAYWRPTATNDGFEDFDKLALWPAILGAACPYLASETGVDKEGKRGKDGDGPVNQLGTGEVGRARYREILARGQLILAQSGWSGGAPFTIGGGEHWCSFDQRPYLNEIASLPDAPVTRLATPVPAPVPVDRVLSPFAGGYKITQRFGNDPDYYKQFGFNGHEGLDLIPVTADWGVHAVEAGDVVRDYDDPRTAGAYGNHVVVLNRDRRRAFWYCHLAGNVVSIGDHVEAGQVIGRMGNTGNSRGYHLHLGLRYANAKGAAINLDNGYRGFVDCLPLLPP